VHNNTKIHIKEISDHGQGSDDQASHHVPPNFGQMPPIPSELANNIGDSNYWLALVAELMKWIPQVPTKTPPKENKLVDRVARWILWSSSIGGMDKGNRDNLHSGRSPRRKKVNIGTYYLTSEADIWWNTVKDKLVGLSLLGINSWASWGQNSTQWWTKRKRRKFMELKMSGTMTMMQYASKFTKLSRFVPEFVSFERLKMRKFEEGLAFYIRN